MPKFNVTFNILGAITIGVDSADESEAYDDATAMFFQVLDSGNVEYQFERRELETVERSDSDEIESMSYDMLNAGWHVGIRDNRLNTNFPGEFMVAEPYDESNILTKNGGNGPFCIVGDDLDELIRQGHSVFLSMAE